jgi:hypothetical protein
VVALPFADVDFIAEGEETGEVGAVASRSMANARMDRFE